MIGLIFRMSKLAVAVTDCYCLVLFSRLALKWSLLYQVCEISSGEWNCPSDMVCIVNLHEETLSIIELGRGRYEGFLSQVIALQNSTSLQLIHAQPKLWRQGRRTEPLSHLCQEGDGWGCLSCCYVWFAWKHPLYLPKSGEHHSCTTVFKKARNFNDFGHVRFPYIDLYDLSDSLVAIPPQSDSERSEHSEDV